MTPNNTSITTGQSPATASSDGFDLDVSLVEVADSASLTNLTNDNCGSTCGACTTNVA
ncbi:FxLD family lanthipeptide [Streptomyces sp. GTA36]|uniref:FxLD family lanthipeptide n=1 Tax=Streptomyces sp. 2-1 TaxID=412710 RepID=UPI003AFAECAB|nr:FxLD family lanthipeptide [Streptomyces phaeochromogenes]